MEEKDGGLTAEKLQAHMDRLMRQIEKGPKPDMILLPASAKLSRWSWKYWIVKCLGKRCWYAGDVRIWRGGMYVLEFSE